MISKIPIEFEWLCPSKNSDFPRYIQLKNDILRTICKGYGTSVYPNHIHEFRLTKEKQHLCIVRLTNLTHKMIACSYVRKDGKRGATTVLPKFRKLGVGTALILETLRVIPKQFGEVEVSNISQIKVLLKSGFTVATDFMEIESRLGTLSKYILSWENVKGIIEYARISKYNKGLIHKFILMYKET